MDRRGWQQPVGDKVLEVNDHMNAAINPVLLLKDRNRLAVLPLSLKMKHIMGQLRQDVFGASGGSHITQRFVQDESLCRYADMAQKLVLVSNTDCNKNT